MTCTDCVGFYGDKLKTDSNLQKTNTFILGCSNLRTSSINEFSDSDWIHLLKDSCPKCSNFLRPSCPEDKKCLGHTYLKAIKRSKCIH
jgi:hypothetical protein